MTRGRCGSLLLHRDGLTPSTPCRSPGALRSTPNSGHSAGDQDGGDDACALYEYTSQLVTVAVGTAAEVSNDSLLPRTMGTQTKLWPNGHPRTDGQGYPLCGTIVNHVLQTAWAARRFTA